MAFKVQVGPSQIAIHQGQTVLVTAPDGQVSWPSVRGLYFRDTRVISAWAIYANGEEWDLLNGGAVAYHAARIFLTNRAIATEDGPIAAHTLGLALGRHVDGGVHEDIDVTNNSLKVRFNLEIAIRADFADIFEVKSDHIVRRGRIATSWSREPTDAALHLSKQGFLPRGHRPYGPDRRRADCERERKTNFRYRAEAWAEVASLPELRFGGWRAVHPGAAAMHQCQRNVGPCQQDGNVAPPGAEDSKAATRRFDRCYDQGVQDMAALRLPLAG